MFPFFVIQPPSNKLIARLLSFCVKFYRIGFFLALAFSAIGPMIAMSVLHTRKEMLGFVGK